MTSVVSNATPLIYLAKTGRLPLLKAVYGEVLIPPEVKAEVVDMGKKRGGADAYAVEAAIDEGWLKTVKPANVGTPLQRGPGEAAALFIARELGLDVLVDESNARAVARLMGLTPRGTLHLLLKALETNQISHEEFHDALSDLARHGFRLREEVYLEAIRKAKEITDKTQ